jgi:riboflavin kinase / FMN adenylyltransferase
MQVFRGFHHPGIAPACALTIGNFDGVHRGHQAMLALLRSEAQHRGVPSCVLTFEPHPRDFFARLMGKEDSAPTRIALLRDKLSELERCGIDQVVVMRFDARVAALSPQAFIDNVLLGGLHARYVLVGDDFRFGKQRTGDYELLDAAGQTQGFDVARMRSYEVHGTRVSSSAVRLALQEGNMAQVTQMLGRDYSISGHVLHGRKLGRDLGFRTLNLRFDHARPAASGIFVVRVHGLGADAIAGVASLGVRPTVEQSTRVLLEVHCLNWPTELGIDAGYGRCVRVDLLHKLHDELRYESLAALKAGIAADVVQARAWLANHAT